MAYLDSDLLDEMVSQIDLLEYAEQTMDFQKHGNVYAAHCPRHIDKTPSLIISPDKNLFHCFSCNKGGSLINFMMTFENKSFNEAIDKIADMTGTDVKSLKQCSCLKVFKDIKRATEMCADEVVVDRDTLDESEVEKFSDELPQSWIDEGIDKNVMRKYQIRVDKRANRIVYPVRDADFKLIGFKGRTLFTNYKEIGIMKYQNYTKIGTTNFFTGMMEAYDSIIARDEIIIVEGIKSVMKIVGWGYGWTVSSETSALNDEQVKILIKMHIKNVVIAYDNDVTMEKLNAVTSKLRKFTNIYVVSDRRQIANKLLPENKMSPCDNGKEVWETLYNERRKL